MRHVSLIISNLPGMEYRYYIVGIHNSSGGFRNLEGSSATGMRSALKFLGCNAHFQSHEVASS